MAVGARQDNPRRDGRGDREAYSRSGPLAPHLFHRRALFWLKLGSLSLFVIAVIAALAAMSVARELLMPVAAGILLGLIIGPIGDRGRKRGIPAALTFSALVLAFLTGMYLILGLLQPIVQDLVAALPGLSQRMFQLWERLQHALGAQPLLQIPLAPVPVPAPPAPPAPSEAVTLATKAVAVLTPALSQLIVFITVLVIFLAGREEIRRALIFSFRRRASRLAMLQTLSSVENQLTDYFQVVTLINAAFGSLIAGCFWLLEVPGAISWGVIAFVLNYLPVVGPLMMKSALAIFGAVFANTVVEGVAPFLCYLGFSLIEANLVTPKIVGKRIATDPLLVFLSIAFWTWLWGFAGAFLAMPILAIASVLLQTFVREKRPELPP